MMREKVPWLGGGRWEERMKTVVRAGTGQGQTVGVKSDDRAGRKTRTGQFPEGLAQGRNDCFGCLF